MKKRRSENQFSYAPRELKDFGNQKSCTVPGQQVSLRKLLEQHSRGMPLPEFHKGQYFGDVDVPDFEEMDHADLYQYQKDLREEIETLENHIRKAQEAEFQRTVEKKQPKKEKQTEPSQEAPEATGNPNESS